jgi:hypothetical protein
MKYTININQFALFNAGLFGKVDYSDISILEYLRDFVYYKHHKSIYVDNSSRPSLLNNKNNKFGQSGVIAKSHSCGHISKEGRGDEYIWLNYNHLIDSLPFAYFKSKASVSRRIMKLRNLGLIETYQASDRTLYYTFTDKMIDLLFSKQTFKPQRARQDRSSLQKSHLHSSSTVPFASAVKDSSGFASMSGNV